MKKKLPIWFYISVFINLLAWAISWFHIEPFSNFMFIFIIGSYIFILDGINYYVNGNSILSRNKLAFWFMWLASILFWWYFEVLVLVTKNWYYVYTLLLDKVSTTLISTLYFSTVIIGVFEIYEILNKNLKLPDIKISFNKKLSLILFFFGVLSVILTIVLPQYFFALMWLSLFFILDPINYWLGYDSLIGDLIQHKFRRLIVFAVSSLTYFVFWEMWNFGNNPKWVYEVPFVGFLKIFEMPILGYLGYLPFGWEIFSFFSFITGLSNSIINRNSTRIKWIVKYLFISILITISVFAIFEIDSFVNSKSYVVDFLISSEVNNTKKLQVFTGLINHCKYSFFESMCLKIDNKYYWLLDNYGLRIKIDRNGNYKVLGTVKKNIYGMDEIYVDKVLSDNL